MDTQTQYQAAQYMAALLVFVGLIAIGMGVAYFHSASRILSTPGMEQTVLNASDLAVNQAETAQKLSDNSWLALIVGFVSITLGSGMNYYLNTKLP